LINAFQQSALVALFAFDREKMRLYFLHDGLKAVHRGLHLLGVDVEN
jgi:hypothetical protein